MVDPFLPDGDGMELIREVSVANPNALALVLSHKLDPALYQKASGAGAERGGHRCGKEFGGRRGVVVRNPSRSERGQGRR